MVVRDLQVSASVGLIWHTLASLGLTLKKVAPGGRAGWPEWREKQPELKPDSLVFIDETWTKTNMTRLYGRAKVGHRLVAAVPHGHWLTSTFVAGLRQDGVVAPCVFKGAINGELFVAYVASYRKIAADRPQFGSWSQNTLRVHRRSAPIALSIWPAGRATSPPWKSTGSSLSISYAIGFYSAATERAHFATTEACHRKLAATGPDLGAYNSTESVADFADLRKALDVAAWNVYGQHSGRPRCSSRRTCRTLTARTLAADAIVVTQPNLPPDRTRSAEA